MEKITSFTIDHLRLVPGVYVSRKDLAGTQTVTTFATFLRNHPEFKDRVLYFGPMGCRTGFYLLLSGDYESADILPLVKEMFQFISTFEGEVPGASAKDCGNYLDMNLPMARFYAKKYLWEVLDNPKDSQLNYPA